jgi:hypothetical protein
VQAAVGHVSACQAAVEAFAFERALHNE